MKKNVFETMAHLATKVGKNWMEAMRYYSLQM